MHCKELRFNRRHAVDFTVYLMWDGQLVEASARNISLHGILLVGKRIDLFTGRQVKVCCIASRRYYELAGTVVHSGNGWVGICFITPQPAFLQVVLARVENEDNRAAGMIPVRPTTVLL